MADANPQAMSEFAGTFGAETPFSLADPGLQGEVFITIPPPSRNADRSCQTR